MIILQFGKPVDMSGMIEQMNESLRTAYPQIIDAIKSVREEGMKTAMITNNWKHPNDFPSVMPIDKSLFDVVRFGIKSKFKCCFL